MGVEVFRFNEIWDEILSKKIIKKNKQYGNSIQEPALVFNDIDDVEALIKIRLDDKLARMKSLDATSEKYDSELKEIVAYLMWLLVVRQKEAKNGETEDRNSNGYEGVSLKDSGNISQEHADFVRNIAVRRLSNK